MIAVIQRVSSAKVEVDAKLVNAIEGGFLVLLGVAKGDNDEDLDWLAQKIVNLRVFSDTEGKMNLSIGDVNGEILLISQFTLLASTKKGNRPSYIHAEEPHLANIMYQKMADKLSLLIKKEVKRGVFGADMKVSLLNDGPVTIVIDTKNRV